MRYLLLTLLLTQLGCYAHQGHALNLDASELHDEATAACQRYDRRAYDTLLKRLIRENPNTEDAKRAQRLLEDPSACQPET